MREIHSDIITNTVRELCIQANLTLPEELEACVRNASKKEEKSLPIDILENLAQNLSAARELGVPICQDTGMVVVFAEIGQDVHICAGGFEQAINEGVRQGYAEGLLRCSVVKDPLRRENTGDNTPAIIHTKIVPGDRLRLTVAPKGFGSENMSRLCMLTPAANEDDIVRFVTQTVSIAGSNPCPPMVIGIGIGGDFEYCALLAKKALCRPISVPNPDEYYANLEKHILNKINALGIGPQGFGGVTTALAVMIETYPTHIAGLPVAVNIGCHVTRHASAEL